MSPASGTQPLEFSTEQHQVISRLASNMRFASILILLLAPLLVVSGVVDVIQGSRGAGIAYVLTALLTGVLGLILLTGADDARFIGRTKGTDKIHFVNTVASLTMYLRVLLGLGVFLGLVLAIRLAQ